MAINIGIFVFAVIALTAIAISVVILNRKRAEKLARAKRLAEQNTQMNFNN